MSRSAMVTRLARLEAERIPDPSQPMMIISDAPPGEQPDEARRIEEASRQGSRTLYLVTPAAEQMTDAEWIEAFCK